MQRKVALVVFIFFFFATFLVSADCPIKVNAKTTADLITEVPSINSQLASCPTKTPSQLSKLTKDGVFLLEITDAQDIAAKVVSGNVTEIRIEEGASYTYKMSVNSCQLNNMLSKENSAGAFAAYYLSGKANLGASGTINKVKLWFAKKFLNPAFKKIQVSVDDCTNVTSKKPENCYDTYLPGYQEYSDPKVKEVWDERLAETGEVCQTQTSEKPKGECKYLYEQVKNNDKKWVCWY